MADLENHSGRTLGEFVLRERIDSGGFGAVYRCHQPLLGREAVVKVMHQRRRHHPAALQRFLREAQLASRLDHPYAAHVYAFGVEDDGLLWIAMELVQGITLNRWLQTRGPLPLDQLVPFFERVAEVVQAAHECGVVHRDLKPSNVMVIERAGQLLPKLLDFGVAKLRDQATTTTIPPPVADDAAAATDPAIAIADIEADLDATPAMVMRPRSKKHGLTRTNAAIGSPPYMSPEQWTDPSTVGPASDLYALGVLAYEALTGRQPFTASTLDDYADLHCHGEVPKLGKGLEQLNEVFERALAKSPDDRWSNALELAAALRLAHRTQMPEQLKVAAQQWFDRAQPDELVWRGEPLKQLEDWSRQPTATLITEPVASFVAASRRVARRATRNRRLLAVLGIAGLLAGVQYRSQLNVRAAEQSVITAEIEQGRSAVTHDELLVALPHLREAYRRGDRSPGLLFMLAVTLRPKQSVQATFEATSGKMWSALFSPFGHRIVTTDERAARIWDAQTFRLLATLPHEDIVFDAAYSTDGAWVVTASADGFVKIWNAATGGLVRSLSHPLASGKRPRYLTVALSIDRKHVAAADLLGNAVHVWNAETGKIAQDLTVNGGEYPSLRFSADGRWLVATGGNDVYLFGTKTWQLERVIPGPRVRGIALDWTGTRLLTGTANGDASIWSLSSGERLHHLRQGEPIDAVAFSPDGKLVATASRDGSEQIWSAETGRLQSQFNHLRGRIYAVEFDQSSKLLLASGADGSVVVTDALNGLPLNLLGGSSNLIRRAHFDPSSGRIVGASWAGKAYLWDAAPPYRHASSAPIGNDCGLIGGVEPDQRFLAPTCAGQRVEIWDAAHDRQLSKLPGPAKEKDFPSPLTAVSQLDGRAVVAIGNEARVYAPGGHLLRSIPHPGPVTAVAFGNNERDVVSGDTSGTLMVTRDGADPIAMGRATGAIQAVAVLPAMFPLMIERVVVGDASGHVRIYDMTRHTMLADLEWPGQARFFRWSSDGRYLLAVPFVVATPAAPMLWDLAEGRAGTLLKGHEGRVFSARFFDGGFLTMGDDSSVRLWDMSTGQLRQTFRARTRLFADAVLSPDGAIVIGGGTDGVLWFWEAATGRLLWKLLVHKSQVVGLHFEGDQLITRAFDGDTSRWALPNPNAVIGACGLREMKDRAGESCATVRP